MPSVASILGTLPSNVSVTYGDPRTKWAWKAAPLVAPWKNRTVTPSASNAVTWWRSGWTAASTSVVFVVELLAAAP